MILTLALAAAAPAAGELPASSSSIIQPARPDPERLRGHTRWLLRFERSLPAIESAIDGLRLERDRWRGTVLRRGCIEAQQTLEALDRSELLRGAEFAFVRDMGDALDELERAAVACRGERYFELDYRLQVGRSTLIRVCERARLLGR